MAYLLSTLLPVFGLILAGFFGRKRNLLGEGIATELNRFVVWFCLPALLFRSTASMPLEAIWNAKFVIAFSLSTLLIFAATLLWKRSAGLNLAQASMNGLCGSYANTGYVGIPLCLLVLGEVGLEPALMSTLIVVSLLYAVAVIFIELDIHKGQSFSKTATRVGGSLLKNPLIVTPFAGIAWNLSGAELNEAIETFLSFLGDATTPCALVSLGAFLARKQEQQSPPVYSLVFIKLVIHPLVTWVLAYHVLNMPEHWAKAAVLLSALPTGTGPYMLAEYYKQQAPLASRSTLVSTLLSLVSLSALLIFL